MNVEYFLALICLLPAMWMDQSLAALFNVLMQRSTTLPKQYKIQPVGSIYHSVLVLCILRLSTYASLTITFSKLLWNWSKICQYSYAHARFDFYFNCFCVNHIYIFSYVIHWSFCYIIDNTLLMCWLSYTIKNKIK